MTWPWRSEARTSRRAQVAQAQAAQALHDARQQQPQVSEVAQFARAVADRLDAMVVDVEQALRRL